MFIQVYFYQTRRTILFCNPVRTTRLSCFEDYPQKYKLHYIHKVETGREESVEAFLGNNVYEALKKLYHGYPIPKREL